VRARAFVGHPREVALVDRLVRLVVRLSGDAEVE
jgi:hypothetical protein